jgi:hypothetical protein
MTGSFATRIFRITFFVAGCYNLAFGLWAGFFPLRFFELFDIPPPLYPEIWACLGMVVGVYGLLYWHAAWKLETAWPIIAIGLLGKVLGPIGMVLNVSEHWPLRLAMLNVFNDVIWWLPFVLFLIRGTSLARILERWPPWLCAVIHAAAAAGLLLFLQPGITTQPDITQRATYIAQHPAAWWTGWILWMLAAESLVLFYAWWGCRLHYPIAVTIAVLITAMGAIGDLAGESFSSLVLFDRSHGVSDGSQFNAAAFGIQQGYTILLSAGLANLLYVVAGIILTLCTRGLPRAVTVAMWLTWIVGIWMSVAACVDSVAGIVASNAILFPILIGWMIWMGWRWRPA